MSYFNFNDKNNSSENENPSEYPRKADMILSKIHLIDEDELLEIYYDAILESDNADDIYDLLEDFQYLTNMETLKRAYLEDVQAKTQSLNYIEKNFQESQDGDE